VHILVINSSAAQGESVSRTLVHHAADLLLSTCRGATIVHRDLGVAPMPHLTRETLAGVRGVPSTRSERAARALSDELIAELRMAETILIGAPMYNFSLPTGLRAWFDYVLRAGETFRYSEAGAQGLLGGKRVIVIESRGGLYSDGPGWAMDFQEPYLRQLFQFVGITDVAFVRAERLAFGPEARDRAIAFARRQLDELIKTEHRDAA
jgi:FMN-dependent NADH-azoreductase